MFCQIIIFAILLINCTKTSFVPDHEVENLQETLAIFENIGSVTFTQQYWKIQGHYDTSQIQSTLDLVNSVQLQLRNICGHSLTYFAYLTEDCLHYERDLAIEIQKMEQGFRQMTEKMIRQIPNLTSQKNESDKMIAEYFENLKEFDKIQNDEEYLRKHNNIVLINLNHKTQQTLAQMSKIFDKLNDLYANILHTRPNIAQMGEPRAIQETLGIMLTTDLEIREMIKEMTLQNEINSKFLALSEGNIDLIKDNANVSKFFQQQGIKWKNYDLDNWTFLEKLATVRNAIFVDGWFFEVQMPLVTNHKFHLLKTIPIPFLVNNVTYVQLSNTKDFLLVDISMNQSYSVSSTFLDTCIVSDITYICPNFPTTILTQQGKCLIDLYNNETLTNCGFEDITLQEPFWLPLENGDAWVFMIRNFTDGRLQCIDVPEQIIHLEPMIGKLRIQYNCQFVTQDAKLYAQNPREFPSIQTKSKSLGKIELMILQKRFSKNKTDEFNSIQLTENQMNNSLLQDLLKFKENVMRTSYRVRVLYGMNSLILLCMVITLAYFHRKIRVQWKNFLEESRKNQVLKSTLVSKEVQTGLSLIKPTTSRNDSHKEVTFTQINETFTDENPLLSIVFPGTKPIVYDVPRKDAPTC